MKINNDWKWAGPQKEIDGDRSPLGGQIVFAAVITITSVAAGVLFWMPFLVLIALVVPWPFLTILAQDGNVSRRLGNTWNTTTQRSYPHDKRIDTYQATQRYKLWNFYNGLHEEVRKDIGKLSINDLINLPESEAQRMWQIFDNLETAFWENKKALPDPVISTAIENARWATKQYKEMTTKMMQDEFPALKS